MSTPEKPKPIRIKLYGLVRMTRRGYVTQLVAGIVLLVAIFLAWYALWPYRRGAPLPDNPGAAFWLLDHLPWLLGLFGLLFALEAVIVLRRFAAAEKTSAASGSDSQG